MRFLAVGIGVILLFGAGTADARKIWEPCHVKNPPQDTGVLLAEATTYFKYWNVNRAANVRLAGQRLDSIVVPPGKQLSYNRTVGPRNEATGFQKAPVISSRRFIDGWGGGVCQTSSTLYSAALKAGMTIVERHPHTWVSAYIAPGFDATVHYPTKDLIIRNPYDFPVTIRVDSDEGQIRVRLLGTEPREGWTEISVRPFRQRAFRVVTSVDEQLDSGSEIVDLEGLQGMHVKRLRTQVMPNGQRYSNKLPVDVYYVRHEVRRIGPLSPESL